MLVDTCNSRSGNQYLTDLVGWRHMIQHDYIPPVVFSLVFHLLLLLSKCSSPKINVH